MRNESTTSPGRLSKNGSSASRPGPPDVAADHHDLAVPPVDERATQRCEHEARAASAPTITRPTAVPELDTFVASARIAIEPDPVAEARHHLREPDPHEPRHAEHRPRGRHRLVLGVGGNERRLLAHAPVSLRARAPGLRGGCTLPSRMRDRSRRLRRRSDRLLRDLLRGFFTAFFAAFLVVFLAAFFATFFAGRFTLVGAASARGAEERHGFVDARARPDLATRDRGVHAPVSDVRAVPTFEHAYRRAASRGVRRARRSAASAGGRAAASAARTAPRLPRA